MMSECLSGAKPWNSTKIGNVDYVSVDQIKTGFEFIEAKRNGTELMLSGAKVELKCAIGSTKATINNISFTFTKPVAEFDSAAYISLEDTAGILTPVLTPDFGGNMREFKTVILDPGDGGEDKGSAQALKVANLTKTKLEQKGFRVVMTRESDKKVPLQEQVGLVNAVQENAIVISLSFNPSSPQAHGIETIASSSSGDTVAFESIGLATATHGTLIGHIGQNLPDGGICRGELKQLTGVRHPSILIHAGSLSNDAEARLIANDAFQAALANGIAAGVLRYQHVLKSKVLTEP